MSSSPDAGSGRSRWRHRLFQLGVALKGIDGLLEIVGGAVLAVVGTEGVTTAVRFLTQHELSEDPNDAVAGWLVHHLRDLGSDTVRFAALYLLAHGVVKVVLTVGLLRGKLSAFPWALGFLGLFALYQGYRLWVHPSYGLGALTVFDLVIMALIWVEYRSLRASPHPGSQ